jgi:hypothetical protein
MGLRLARPGAARKETGRLTAMLPKPGNLIAWSALYGALGFVAGFAFGALRQLVLIPAFGDRMGHLIEFPMVTLAACAIGLWIGARTSAPALAIGALGVLVLIVFESTMALGLLRVSLTDYLAGYDLMRGSLFPVGLALMALAPLAGRWLKRE